MAVASPDSAVRGLDFPIVGVGASAGGVEAAQNLFSRLPPDSGLAFVLVLHLDPTRESLVDRVMAARTRIPVVQASEGVRLEPNRIYVAPPGHPLLTIRDGVLSLGRHQQSRSPQDRLPIDGFLTSLAADQRERAACVILSGSGNDGARGVREIVAAGGLAIVQDPQTAAFDGMPQSAIGTGAVDYVLPLHEIPAVLLRLARVRRGARLSDRGPHPEPLPALLAVLRLRLGIDFGAYKKRTLVRRIHRRMVLRHVESFSDYMTVLRDDASEAHALARDFCIGVTEFFREPEAWTALEKQVVAPLVRRAIPGQPIRLWVAGCATGEEAYSVGMLFLEHIESSGRPIGLQIFASDVSEEALAVARAGRYAKGIESHMSPARLRHFFARVEGSDRLQVRKDLRDVMVFSAHNLLADPPYSHVDLICCRNLLIYLESDMQQSVLSVFRFALKPEGFLFLGSAESVGDNERRFRAMSKKWRIFQHMGDSADARTALLSLPRVGRRPATQVAPAWVPAVRENRYAALAQQVVLERFAPASVLVNGRNEALHLSGLTDEYLRHPRGKPTYDLTQLVREGLSGRLREALAATMDGKRSVEIKDVRVKRRNGFYPVRITVLPVAAPAGQDGPLRLVVFEEDPHPSRLKLHKGRASEPHVMRQLENELLVARSELKTSLDQLESSNEGYRAANEEAMSINEELQAANEELETSREELQSLNEELTTVNSQLQQKVSELEASNNDLANLFASTDIATLCLDREYRIKWFTPATTGLLNLLPGDRGRSIRDFAPRFQDGDLHRDVDLVMRKLTPIEHPVRGDDGRWFIERVLPYRTQEDRIDGVVVTFTDITTARKAEEALQALNETLERRVELRTRHLKILQEAAVIANEARALGDAVADTLAVICRDSSWVVAHALLAGADEPAIFADSGVWWRAPSRNDREFERGLGAMRFRAGPDVVGQVIATGRSLWVADLSILEGTPWAEAALEAGLRSAFIVPVSAGHRVVGVLEFFSDQTPEVEEWPEDVMNQIGTQLGRAVERSRFEIRLTGFADEERREIAQEVHDRIGQRLVGLGMLSASLRRDLLARGLPEAAQVTELVRNIDESRKEVRALTRGLLPVDVAADGLMSALSELAAQYDLLPNVDCHFICERPVPIQDPASATHLYRIAQEAVRNAVEHGQASRVTVKLENNDRVAVTVSDNGAGIRESSEGDGLRIMSYRARRMGATLRIGSPAGGGTIVTCELPRQAPAGRDQPVLAAEFPAAARPAGISTDPREEADDEE